MVNTAQFHAGQRFAPSFVIDDSDPGVVLLYGSVAMDGKIEHARAEAGVSIAKRGAHFSILDWGPAIKQRGARLALNGSMESAPALIEKTN